VKRRNKWKKRPDNHNVLLAATTDFVADQRRQSQSFKHPNKNHSLYIFQSLMNNALGEKIIGCLQHSSGCISYPEDHNRSKPHGENH